MALGSKTVARKFSNYFFSPNVNRSLAKKRSAVKVKVRIPCGKPLMGTSFYRMFPRRKVGLLLR